MLKKAKQERLRWACRRGMLELDLLLSPFYDNCFHQLTETHKAEFEKLLSFQDQQLYNWFLGIESADVEVQQIIEIIKRYRNVEVENPVEN